MDRDFERENGFGRVMLVGGENGGSFVELWSGCTTFKIPKKRDFVSGKLLSPQDTANSLINIEYDGYTLKTVADEDGEITRFLQLGKTSWVHTLLYEYSKRQVIGRSGK